MKRVIAPLEMMGARIETEDPDKERMPLSIRGGRKLQGIDYALPVASAQVKTAILLAGIHAEGETRVREPLASRDHTELALVRYGAAVQLNDRSTSVRGGHSLEPVDSRLPGDVSSAAFFICTAAAIPGSELVVETVGLNPTRTGFLEVLRAMGARLTIEEDTNERESAENEPEGSIRVLGSELSGTEVSAEIVPTLIDEIPILAVAAALAKGETIFRGVAELRHKESDRLETIANGLRALGTEVETLPNDLRIRGGQPLKAASLESRGDHRMAMAWAMASLASDGDCEISGRDRVTVSYPGFWDDLDRLVA
jgi:3-phosphoshikimate 1-carboxyvinyltransferase